MQSAIQHTTVLYEHKSTASLPHNPLVIYTIMSSTSVWYTCLQLTAGGDVQDGEQMCRYRIVQDGLPLLLPYVTRQLLQPTVQELLHLIEDRSLYVPEEARAVLADADQQPGVEVKGEPMEQVAADSGAAADSGVAAGSEVTAELEVKTEEAEDKQANAEGTDCMHCCSHQL